MQPHILVADGFSSELFPKLCDVDGLKVHPKAKVTPEQLNELIPEIEGLVIRSATTVNEELLEKAAKLKYVIRAGEGTDNIDKGLCAKRGVKVSNTPGANNNSAAEHAIALIFTALRRTAEANASMHAGRWDKSLYVGNELSNKKVGIVGFGRIGQIVAKRLQGFEPEVLFYDPFVTESNLPYAKSATLEQVFSESDIVTIHVPLLDATKNLVGPELLNKMKPSAFLINASRGKIVDEQALYDTLKQQKIKAAAFDVFASEPLEADSKLRELDNMLMTPHLGASTEEAQLRVGEMVIHQLKEFFLNDNLLNEVKA